jgi:hypothetical protein
MLTSLPKDLYKFRNLHIKKSHNAFKYSKYQWHTSEFVKIMVGNTDDNRTQEHKSNKTAIKTFGLRIFRG